ncbi:hypothetical protein EIN_215490 [Entamoeba invadens IP1]|uniref:Furin repeat-containing protein n=2 Tax=Entamoeba invadens TaxID=33085 RepID=A0A0A1U0W2_ENTIV|nr:hypothetical protein EIN_215490 [Entamoeba invadens IP1]ELP87571.1 hypothetical protein EIN_215490 [Entamoeba invadens IP1]BAN41163.1 hypothetical protein [Entamoeba invadens]|eukprot:XP_004254342.1 hypothetical protein EIN_215490 [Entamoeba invadens IP1]
MIFALLIAFSLAADKCTMPYCGTCEDAADKCNTCVTGYLLNSEGKCEFGRDKNCESPFLDVCVKCSDGYMYDVLTKTCKKGVELCFFQYDTSLQLVKCSSCYNNLTVFTENNTCIDCIAKNPNCLKTDKDDCRECSVCRDGYKLTTDNKCEVVPNCAVVNSDGSCTMCIDGFYLENSECKRGNIDECMIYKNSEACSKCNSGKTVLNGKCQYVPFCYLFNKDKTKCIICVNGYGLNNTDCVPCLNSNCTSCNADYTKCSGCVDGMYPDENGVCTSCIENCKSCSDATSCDVCMSGFYRTADGKCEVNNVENCEEAETQSTCSKCKIKFYLNTDAAKCESCTDNTCESFTTEESCGQCGNCKSIRLGSSFKCIVNDNCYSYDNDRSICVECLQGYYLTKDYTCEKCDDKCKNGCVNKGSECSLYDTRDIPYCVSYDENHKCVVCGYGDLENGVCDVEDYCKVKAYDGKCVECFTGEQTTGVPSYYAIYNESCYIPPKPIIPDGSKGVDSFILLTLFLMVLII